MFNSVRFRVVIVAVWRVNGSTENIFRHIISNLILFVD